MLYTLNTAFLGNNPSWIVASGFLVMQAYAYFMRRVNFFLKD